MHNGSCRRAGTAKPVPSAGKLTHKEEALGFLLALKGDLALINKLL